MITGSFYNRDNEEVTVQIGADVDIELGEESGYYFSGSEPVTISVDNSDTFNEIATETCSIKIMSENYIPELYSQVDREIPVIVLKKTILNDVTLVDRTMATEEAKLPETPTTKDEGPIEYSDEIVLNDTVTDENVPYICDNDGNFIFTSLSYMVEEYDYKTDGYFKFYNDGGFKRKDVVTIHINEIFTRDELGYGATNSAIKLFFFYKNEDGEHIEIATKTILPEDGYWPEDEDITLVLDADADADEICLTTKPIHTDSQTYTIKYYLNISNSISIVRPSYTPSTSILSCYKWGYDGYSTSVGNVIYGLEHVYSNEYYKCTFSGTGILYAVAKFSDGYYIKITNADNASDGFKNGDVISISYKLGIPQLGYIENKKFVLLHEFEEAPYGDGLTPSGGGNVITGTYTLNSDYDELCLVNVLEPPSGSANTYSWLYITDFTVKSNSSEEDTHYHVTLTDGTYTLPTNVTVAGSSDVLKFYTISQPAIYSNGISIPVEGLSTTSYLKITSSDGFKTGDRIIITGFTNSDDTAVYSSPFLYQIFSGGSAQIVATTDTQFPVLDDHSSLKEVTFTLTSDISNNNLYIGLFGTNTGYGCVITSIKAVHNPSYTHTIFSGYVQAQTYDLPYAYQYTEIEINAEDYLSTLENHTYREDDIETYGYSNVRAEAKNELITNILTDGLGLSMSDTDLARFEGFKISELLLLGDDADDVETCNDILIDICNYFNVHVIAANDPIYLNQVTFYTYEEKRQDSSVVFADYAGGKDTTFSFDAVYNYIKLTDNTQDEETVVASPLDDDSLTSLFVNKQIMYDEYYSAGEGKTSQKAFKNIIRELTSDYDAFTRKSYFFLVYQPTNWELNTSTYINGLYNATSKQYENQWKVPQYLHDNPFKCAIFSVGNTDGQTSGSDNSPVNSVDMTKYMYISVNGTAEQSSFTMPVSGIKVFCGYYPYDQPGTFPGKEDIETWVNAGNYLAKYNGNSNGGVLGGIDEKTTNYFVFSGSIILQPEYHLMYSKDGTKHFLAKDPTIYDYLEKYMANGQYMKGGTTGMNAFYTCRFYDKETPASDNTSSIRTANSYDADPNLQFYNSDFDFKPESGYETDVFGLCTYKDGTDTDTISKVPILKCAMSVGSKDLIEYELGKYKWIDKTDTTTKNFDDTYEHMFTLGFDPKLDDCLFNEEFDIQNNIDYTMNIDDEEGTAIALDTAMAGEISFKIISPFPVVWSGNVCTRTPSFWHHSQWDTKSCEILPFVKNIIIKDFECKIVSNNGNTNNYNEQDLVFYTGDILDTGTYGKKDDIEFNYTTALTTDQALEHNQSPGPKLSNMIYNDLPFTGYNDDVDDKPEKRYIDDKYEEYHVPRILMKSTILGEADFRKNYKMNQPDKTFMPIEYEYNVRNNTTKYTLKEIW